MTVVQSLDQVVALSPGWLPAGTFGYYTTPGSIGLYNDLVADYAQLYSQQPAVRTVVEFLARNIAQLGLHVFRRVSDTDRQRLIDHPLAQLLERPNPWTTRYRLIDATMQDLGIYWNAYWLKVRVAGQMRLMQIPPRFMRVKGTLVPVAYEIMMAGKIIELDPTELVHFRGYNPNNALVGLSPLETLRRMLAEEQAANDYREGFWKNSARISGVLERPAGAAPLSDDASKRLRAQWEAMYAGENGSGRTAILEEGMTFKSQTYDFQQSQYLETRKLNREEVAAAYHIPPPAVGILERATHANITEQHKDLYQDTLGPWLEMLQSEIELQLLPEFPDQNGIYLEFNLADKLKGSFEEQATAFSTAVGRPWLTADEARARQNLPGLGGDAAVLVTPLNVLVGGQASPRDSAPPPKGTLPKGLKAASGEIDATLPAVRARHREQWTNVLGRFFARQQSAVLARLGKGQKRVADAWDETRWNRELKADVLALSTATATVFGQHTATAFGAVLDVPRLGAWLDEHSMIAAERINRTTRQQLQDAEGDAEAQARVFGVATSSRAAQIAQTQVTQAANFGAHSGAEQAGARRKRWVTTNPDARPSHAAANGTTLALGDEFDVEGQRGRWPGEPKLGAANVAGCTCSLAFLGG